MHTDSDGADCCYLQYYKQKLTIAIMHTKVVICNCCIQKLSFAIVAYKSYRSFDAILQFLHFEQFLLQWWFFITPIVFHHIKTLSWKWQMIIRVKYFNHSEKFSSHLSTFITTIMSSHYIDIQWLIYFHDSDKFSSL